MNNLSLLLALLIPIYALAEDFEEIPPNELSDAKQIVTSIETMLRNQDKRQIVRRDAHVKAHGCVKAQFRVLPDIPLLLKQGIFKTPQAYSAWIRYSNGAGKVQDDSVGDGRGMAIKLLGVEKSASGTQDFVMINHPVFFVRNVADYVEFQKSIAEDQPLHFFFPSWIPWNFRMHELLIANSIRNTAITNPLDSQYWSMTPYLLGESAIKFTARPCHAPIVSNTSSGTNYLQDNMRQHLAQNAACFDFQVQLRSLPKEMPIEDPTIEWDESDSPFVSVAKITIPSQTFTSDEQLKFCENLSFTPWHTLPEHRPLGGINRVRKIVYETVSRLRHELNAEKAQEPTGF